MFPKWIWRIFTFMYGICFWFLHFDSVIWFNMTWLSATIIHHFHPTISFKMVRSSTLVTSFKWLLWPLLTSELIPISWWRLWMKILSSLIFDIQHIFWLWRKLVAVSNLLNQSFLIRKKFSNSIIVGSPLLRKQNT